jgi:hypothetical protein
MLTSAEALALTTARKKELQDAEAGKTDLVQRIMDAIGAKIEERIQIGETSASVELEPTTPNVMAIDALAKSLEGLGYIYSITPPTKNATTYLVFVTWAEKPEEGSARGPTPWVCWPQAEPAPNRTWRIQTLRSR